MYITNIIATVCLSTTATYLPVSRAGISDFFRFRYNSQTIIYYNSQREFSMQNLPISSTFPAQEDMLTKNGVPSGTCHPSVREG
jgi:hypothetical protein